VFHSRAAVSAEVNLAVVFGVFIHLLSVAVLYLDPFKLEE